MFDWLFKPIEWVLDAVRSRRRLFLRVHRAFFVGSRRECYFLNATNMSHDREIEITHVWFDCQPPVHVLQADRPLPTRLRPDESWETWIAVDELPVGQRESAYILARARMSTGKVVKSVRNPSVPPFGAVPGGPIRNVP